MANEDLCYIGAAEALARFRDRTLSPVELMDAVIARSEAVEPRLNHFTYCHFDRARDQARVAEARYAGKGPRPRALEGLPVAIKDENTIKGERTTSGSPGLLHCALAKRLNGLADCVRHFSPATHRP